MSDTREPILLDPDGVPVGVVSSSSRHQPRWWLHALLLAVTLLTTTFFGALFAGWLPDELAQESFAAVITHPSFIAEGLKFSLPLLFILLCHETAHYVAARRHGLAATPPYFIPAPIGIGTFGALIKIKEPIRTNKQLLDVGAAGPIAGFVATLPFLFVGIAASRVADIPLQKGVILFGEPLAFTLMERLAFPTLGPEQDLFLHPTGFAAWFGLLVTALNMLPFAQLDGGHVAYALFGSKHRRAAWPLWTLLFLLGFRWSGWWIWAVIALVMGVVHPRMPNEDVPLDPRRRLVGYTALAILVLCFMPQPVRFL